MSKHMLGPGSQTDQLIRRLEKQNKKILKSLKDTIPATSDYNLAEGQQIPKKVREEFNIREDWNGCMSGEWARKQLRQVAREWVEELDSACENLESDNDWIELMIRETSHRGNWGRDVIKRWIKHFFNLENEANE